MNFNQVVIGGNLTRDVELKYINDKWPIANFSIAVEDTVKKGEVWVKEIGFFDCAIWGKQAESLSQNAGKGSNVLVSGRLRHESWEKDGAKRSKVTVLADRIQLCGNKPAPNERQENQVF